MSSCLFPISMMDADHNKHISLLLIFLFSHLIHISFSLLFFPFKHSFLGWHCMATARFDMSVAMEEHFNKCVVRASQYYLLIGCSMPLTSLSFELGSALCYFVTSIQNFQFLCSHLQGSDCI